MKKLQISSHLNSSSLNFCLSPGLTQYLSPLGHLLTKLQKQQFRPHSYPGDHQIVEDEEHIILHCDSLAPTRTSLAKLTVSYSKTDPLIGQLLLTYTNPRFFPVPCRLFSPTWSNILNTAVWWESAFQTVQDYSYLVLFPTSWQTKNSRKMVTFLIPVTNSRLNLA